MKKSAIGTQNHAKPFIVAIGIAFTFLALVVIYVAFTKGGLDIRSRAGLAKTCDQLPVKKTMLGITRYSCSGSGYFLDGMKCCKTLIGTLVPTPKAIQSIKQCQPGTAGCVTKQGQVIQTNTTPQCRPGTAGCVVKQGQLIQVQSTVTKSTPVPTKKLMSCAGAGSSCSSTTKCCGSCVNGKCR